MKGVKFSMSGNNPKRTDKPDKTTKELLDSDWVFVHNKYENLINGAMRMVRSELDRHYWNVNQQEMVSPFDNTGAPDFVTDYLTIRSYNWDENELPNFDTDQLKVFWYKYSGRGILAMMKKQCDVGETLTYVLNMSLESIVQHFKNKGRGSV